MDWSSVRAPHVSQACDTLVKSVRPVPKPRGLVVNYNNHQLPAKAVLRLAYCIANNLPHESKLKFASGESSLQLLRTLGFRAERMENAHPTSTEE